MAIQFPDEPRSNAVRQLITEHEPQAARTFTPSQAVLARSAGIYHWTADGRRLYDFTSGVLVANLGHNPVDWTRRWVQYMGWSAAQLFAASSSPDSATSTTQGGGLLPTLPAVPLTAYNAITEVESLAVQRLLESLRRTSGGQRLDTIVWAASGSEAVQKALWACLARDRTRDMILATRYGFHGKKGLSNAVTGSETDAERDPRVKFVSFPREEIADHDGPAHIDLDHYRRELDDLWRQFGRRLTCLITEPYLGGGGSYHPPASYLQLLQQFCREHDLLFVLDEVQANFGRTGSLYAFEKYGLEPDFVVLGKGLGNGVPVSATAGPARVFAAQKYGEASDTWSANPLGCAAVLATLDEFASQDWMAHVRKLTPVFFAGLDALKSTGVIKHVRGEGLVFGIECAAVGHHQPNHVANAVVEECYRGTTGDGIHLLGALAGKVIRVSPPLTISVDEARDALRLMHDLVDRVGQRLRKTPAST